MWTRVKIWLSVLWSDTKYIATHELKSDVSALIQEAEKKESDMNFLSILQLIFKLTPYIVAGVQTLHPSTPGTTKKQIATDLLQTAVAGATSVLSPQNSQIAQAIGGAASAVIDATVATHQAAGVAGFVAPSTEAAVAQAVNTAAPVTQIPGSR